MAHNDGRYTAELEVEMQMMNVVIVFEGGGYACFGGFPYPVYAMPLALVF